MTIRPKKMKSSGKMKGLMNRNRNKGLNANKKSTRSSVCVVAVPACLHGTDKLKTRLKTGMKKK